MDPDGPSRFDAHIYAACQVPARMTSEVCTEEIMLRVGGELAQHLASTVAPLLIHDLPVVLWWPDDVPFESGVLRELVASSDRLFVDSSNFRGTALDRMVGMATILRSGVVVHDIAWMRLMLWRELFAGLFDHPLLRPELRTISGLRIDIARPGSVVRLNRAALFAGWLAAMLDWKVLKPLEIDADGVYRGLMRAGKREIQRRDPARSARPRAARCGPPAHWCVPRSRLDAHGPRCASASPASPITCSARPTGTAPRSRVGRHGWRPSTRCPSWPRRSTGRVGTGCSSAALDRAVKLTAALVPATGPSAGTTVAATPA